MAENLWVLQDGRSILVEFSPAATPTNWGWFGNRSSGEGLEFAAPATAWANHAWDRGAQYVMPADVGGGTVYADSLSVGSYSISGKSVTDLIARLDSLSTGSYAVSGKAVTDVVARYDSLSTGAYSISGKDITDVKTSAGTTYADNLLAGSYAIAGQALTDSKVIADSLSTGAYAIAGKDISDVVARGDSLQVGSYVITGRDITDVKTGAVAYFDDLSAGDYLLTGNSISDDYVQATVTQVGGGGYFDYHAKKLKKKREYDELKAKEAYELLMAEANESLKKEAVRLIKPFTESKAKAPKVKSIDWAALEYEKYRVNSLLALWEEQLDIEREDEEILLLM